MRLVPSLLRHLLTSRTLAIGLGAGVAVIGMSGCGSSNSAAPAAPAPVSFTTSTTTGRTAVATPMVTALAGRGYDTLPLLTTGDTVPLLTGTWPNLTPSKTESYAFSGIPDGIGCYEDGTYIWVWVNHEHAASALTDFSPTISGQVAGSRVSLLKFDKSWKCLGGMNLISSMWDGATQIGSLAIVNDAVAQTGYIPSRFCSSSLADKGFVGGPIYFTGEEAVSGANGGRGFAVTPDGKATWIKGLGIYAKENILPASQYRGEYGANSILLSCEDNGQTNSEVYLYKGTKTVADPNGFAAGQLYFLRVNDGASVLADETTFVKGKQYAANWVAVDQTVTNILTDAAVLNTHVETTNAGNHTNFFRPEDLTEDPTLPGTFYFVSTQGATPQEGALYKLTFNPADPTGTGTIELLLSGGSQQGISYDNITVDGKGRIWLCEDTTGDAQAQVLIPEDRPAGTWVYDPKDDTVTQVLSLNQAPFGLGGSGNYGLWETSGVLAISKDQLLIDVQAHTLALSVTGLTGDHDESGQLLLVRPNPALARTPVSNTLTNGRTAVGPMAFTVSPAGDGYDAIPLLTTGDTVPLLVGKWPNLTVDATHTYAMPGIPDGIGCYTSGGFNWVWVNHELTDTQSSEVSPTFTGTTPGARISLFKFDLSWRCLGGQMLDRKYLDPATSAILAERRINPTAGTVQSVGASWSRFCSGSLAGDGFFGGPVYFTGEESTSGSNLLQGRAFAFYPDGRAVWLKELGIFAHENIVALRNYRGSRGPFTVLLSGEDGDQNSAMVLYKGNNTATDPNGFAAGSSFVLRVDDGGTFLANETFILEDTAYTATWTQVDETVTDILASSAVWQTWTDDVPSQRKTNFARIEDSAEDPSNPGTIYFTTTGRTNAPLGGTGTEPINSTGRLYKLVLDPTDPTAPGTITQVHRGGSLAGVSFDNVTVDTNGKVLLQEDETAGTNAIMAAESRQASIWEYSIGTDSIARLAELAQDDFVVSPGGTGVWESSGILHVGNTGAKGIFLFDVQAHNTTVASTGLSGNHPESGQLLLLQPFGTTFGMNFDKATPAAAAAR